jgi:drug/metabolite transporter (DMT)-like permease
MIGIAYPLWFSCLKRLPASHVSIFIYLTPIFAVILSLIILNERFSWWFWLGGACIIGGIVITNMLTRNQNSKES